MQEIRCTRQNQHVHVYQPQCNIRINYKGMEHNYLEASVFPENMNIRMFIHAVHLRGIDKLEVPIGIQDSDLLDDEDLLRPLILNLTQTHEEGFEKESIGDLATYRLGRGARHFHKHVRRFLGYLAT